MTYSIQILFKADRELFEAWEWYEEQQEGLGDRFRTEFFQKLSLIQNDPYHYPSKGRYRETLISDFPYLIVYRISDKDQIIYIASVFHTSRSPRRKLK